MTDHKNDTTELVMAIGALIRRVRANAPSEMHEFSWTQKSVLARLEIQGPTTIADLARAEGVKPQSMSTALATLEELGLVERKPHPTDGRQVNIKLTTKAAALRRGSRDAKSAWLSEAIAKLPKHEQVILFKSSEIIKRLAETL